jgi:hypothetical protein
MKNFVKFIPAIGAAIAAYLVNKFLFFWNDSFSVDFIGYLVVFSVAYFVMDMALRQYGSAKR